MSKGKYIIPVVMGQPGSELFLVHGEIPRGQSMALVRMTAERALVPSDEKALAKLLEKVGSNTTRPKRVKEVTLITADTRSDVSAHEATLVHGYVTNILPGAFKAPEMSNWYLFERPGDITSLKMARFAINLLDRSERTELLKVFGGICTSNGHARYNPYR